MPNFSNLNFNDFRTIAPLPGNNQTRGDVQPLRPHPRGASVRPCTDKNPCISDDTTNDPNNPDTTNKISTTTIAIIGGVVVLALAGGYWFFTHKKK